MTAIVGSVLVGLLIATGLASIPEIRKYRKVWPTVLSLFMIFWSGTWAMVGIRHDNTISAIFNLVLMLVQVGIVVWTLDSVQKEVDRELAQESRLYQEELEKEPW